MSRIKTFIGLDFMAMKPFLKFWHFFVYFVLLEYMTVLGSMAVIAISCAMAFAVLITAYPFAIGEKTNMDALYPTLSVNRKSVVQGRYLFAVACDVAILLFTFICIVIGKCIRLLWKGNADISEFFGLTIAIVITFFIIQLIQLPIYFKIGYTKAKLFTTISFGMFTYFCVAVFSKIDQNKVARFYENKPLFTFTVIAAVLILTLISYSLSVLFYKKREF
jgi:ABC-type transport system involved in multi-copper enzyme maturation permease subunit